MEWGDHAVGLVVVPLTPLALGVAGAPRPDVSVASEEGGDDRVGICDWAVEGVQGDHPGLHAPSSFVWPLR